MTDVAQRFFRQVFGLSITLLIMFAIVFGFYWYATGSADDALTQMKQIGSFFWQLGTID